MSPTLVDIRRRVDWSQIVLELRRSGLTDKAISDACEVVHHSWAARLANIPGSQPKYTHGVLLLALWLERVGDGVDSIPRY